MLNFTLPYPAAAAVAALAPMIVGFVWYGPLFGKAWLSAAGLSPESARQGFNAPLVFGLAYLLSFFMAAMIIAPLSIHQMGFGSMMVGVPEMKDTAGDAYKSFHYLQNHFSGNYRTFRHGALHGTFAGLFFAMPVVAINAMFERKGFKYIAINAGFWIVSCILMGAIVCHFIPLQMQG